MPRKLTYFQLNGVAEPIRYMLHYGKLEFEDLRYNEWPIPDVIEKLPYGKLPVYEQDGKVLNQSMAIARYVASQVNLLPSDVWEQAQLDANVLNIYDFIEKSKPYFNVDYNPNKNNINHEEKEETLKFFLSRFEKELKAGNGHFGGKLSWADFVLVGIVELFGLYLGQPIEKNYPTIISLMSKIHSLPGVKEYIAEREPYTLYLVNKSHKT